MASKISTFLWFEKKVAEDAATHYVQIFNNAPSNASHPPSEILAKTHYSEAGKENHGQEPGSVMTVEYSLRGQRFVNLNGGAQGWTFNYAVSFQVECEDQAETDYFWGKLGEGSDEEERQCGWLRDKFGVVWQVVPRAVSEMMKADDKEAVGRATAVMMGQKKLDVEALNKAFKGE